MTSSRTKGIRGSPDRSGPFFEVPLVSELPEALTF
jgi:hypothetical protein